MSYQYLNLVIIEISLKFASCKNSNFIAIRTKRTGV